MLGAKQEHKISFTLDGSAAAPNLPVIHHLAAKVLITDWEIENKDKKSIVDLSIESSVISSHTAFIAIDEESSEPVSGAMKTYDIQSGLHAFNSSSDDSDDYMVYGCMDMDNFGMSAADDCIAPQLNLRRSALDEMCEEELEYDLESWSEGEGQERVLKQRMEKKEKRKATNKIDTGLTNVITAQQVNGSWALTSSFAQLIAKCLPDFRNCMPH